MKFITVLIAGWLIVPFISQNKNRGDNPIKINIRYFEKYYSINIINHRQAFVVKGQDTYFTKPMEVFSADTSNIFKIALTCSFYNHLNKIKAKYDIKKHVGTDAPIVEIYYNHQKIFNDSIMKTPFLDFIRPLIGQLPEDYNPFLSDNHAFQ